MKDVKITTPFITLGQLIKFLNLIGSGGEVKLFIMQNQILFNDEPENRRGKKIYP
ncbi:MAG: RNA-binding S4 domain-containing protein, partial [Candidatus Izemoplasmatales bacterium]|nr:RNA-binding S4 domain-containing protein [Candidatus Izemoplasmatales bacterium]